MAERESAEEKLARLRELILHARSMPMSASCVINRSDVLAAIDDVIEHLPDEVAEAQHVIDSSLAKIAEGEAEAERIIREAREQAAELAENSEVIRVAEDLAAKLKADAASEAEALRRETDIFIDSRMASFESVLHKTASQVKTARIRLSERSSLDHPVPSKSADSPRPPEAGETSDPAAATSPSASSTTRSGSEPPSRPGGRPEPLQRTAVTSATSAPSATRKTASARD